MASAKNDALLDRTVEGSLNYYDGHKACGTATDKGLAARLGGHSYNILSNKSRDEIYFPEMRHDEHFVDSKGHHTAHLFGARRKKFQEDPPRDALMKDCFKAPADHPRENGSAQRRLELGLAQIENHNSWEGFQNRCQSTFFAESPPKRYSINNARYANEVEKLRPRVTDRGMWQQRRGEPMTQSISAPSLRPADAGASLDRAVRTDARKEATQRQTESSHFAPWQTANSYSCSVDAKHAGRKLAKTMQHCSVNRLENHDFAVSRKNNHYSSQDKLTRSDPFFMRPRLATTNNSVKYDIISNERRWFRY